MWLSGETGGGQHKNTACPPFPWTALRHVDDCVHQGNRSTKGQRSAVQRYYLNIAGSGERRSGLGNNGSCHGPASCCVDDRKTANLPKYILGLGSAGQDDTLRECRSRTAHRECRCHLENPDSICVTLGIKGEISALNHERPIRGSINARNKGFPSQVASRVCANRHCHQGLICGLGCEAGICCNQACSGIWTGRRRTGSGIGTCVNFSGHSSDIGKSFRVDISGRIVESGYCRRICSNGPDITFNDCQSSSAGHPGSTAKSTERCG